MPVHEGSHASTTNSPLMWRLQGAIHDFGTNLILSFFNHFPVNGASFYNWCHQHFLGHHPFTNVTEPSRAMDPDVVTNDPDVRRIKESQTYHNHYQYQKVLINCRKMSKIYKLVLRSCFIRTFRN
jgi:hypothetical protein